MILMHKNAMDVCYRVLRTPYKDHKRTKYKGEWINLGYSGQPWVIQASPLEIAAADMHNWVPLSESQIKIKRTKSGLPV